MFFVLLSCLQNILNCQLHFLAGGEALIQRQGGVAGWMSDCRLSTALLHIRQIGIFCEVRRLIC